MQLRPQAGNIRIPQRLISQLDSIYAVKVDASSLAVQIPMNARIYGRGVDWDWFELTLKGGIERFPWLSEARLDRQACWWGYYEVTPDHNPILGRYARRGELD